MANEAQPNNIIRVEAEEYDMDALLQASADTNQPAGDEVEHCPESGTPSNKRAKRFSMEQTKELEAVFQECTHPDDMTRKELGARIGLEERQVKFWFQNRRSQRKLKAYGTDNRSIHEENKQLAYENMRLLEQMQEWACFRCLDDPAVAAEQRSEKWQLLNENARLKDVYQRTRADLEKLVREGKLPPAAWLECLESAPAPPPMGPADQPLIASHNAAIAAATTDKDALVSRAECALIELQILTVKQGEPMWLPAAIHGEVLNLVEYNSHSFPRQHGLRPHGFIVEASRDTALVRATSAELVGVFANAESWAQMFPDIVGHVMSRPVICGDNPSSPNGLIQMMNAELLVPSPCVPIRQVEFLRFSKQTGNGQWVVVDVSVDDINGVEQEGGSTTGYTGCRLLPSGCLLEDMNNGYCQVTWIVHAEYNDTIVPALFKPLVRSGQAFGACRWIASLQRHCDYMAALGSTHVPSSHGTGAGISMQGRRSILELAQRMKAIFYPAVSGQVTLAPANCVVNEWRGNIGTTTGDVERSEAAVRMVVWNFSDAMAGAAPAVLMLSATTTVWLPDTPPRQVLEYLCDWRRRGEWDALVDGGGAVQELGRVGMSANPLVGGNSVSVLRPNVTGEGTSSKMLILQDASSSSTCSLVVYSCIEENLMRGVMGGGGSGDIFLLPSGFSILPDGRARGKGNHTAASSSSAHAASCSNTAAGSLVTVANQALLPGFPSNLTEGLFEDAGNRLCHVIKKIKAAVGADIVIPA